MRNLVNRIPRTVIHTTVAIMAIVFSTAYGVIHYEDAIDNEKLEIETAVSNQKLKQAETATTTIPILVYHKIWKDPLLPVSKPKAKFSVPETVFDEQMAYIQSHGYIPLTMAELVAAKNNNTIPSKPIVITFDDGWKSQYDLALPILLKYHIPATFYIYTGVVGDPAYMSWDDLKALRDLNMEIGDHTKSHPRLTKVSDEALQDEIVGSRNDLEQNLGIKVTDFAYPYGAYDSRVENAVIQAGYASARTSNKGIYNNFKDMYQLNVIYSVPDLKTFEEMLERKMF